MTVARRGPAAAATGLADRQLLAICVGTWCMTWYAITSQLGLAARSPRSWRCSSDRRGAERTVGVLVPLPALAVSVAFEGYRPDAFTFFGAALALAGNALMLRPRRPAAVTAAGSAPVSSA